MGIYLNYVNGDLIYELENFSLNEIDEITSNFSNMKELINSSRYGYKIGQFKYDNEKNLDHDDHISLIYNIANKQKQNEIRKIIPNCSSSGELIPIYGDQKEKISYYYLIADLKQQLKDEQKIKKIYELCYDNFSINEKFFLEMGIFSKNRFLCSLGMNRFLNELDNNKYKYFIARVIDSYLNSKHVFLNDNNNLSHSKVKKIIC